MSKRKAPAAGTAGCEVLSAMREPDVAKVAADVLCGELAHCRAAIAFCMEILRDENDYAWDSRLKAGRAAGELMRTAAALAASIARLSGEVRQRITVEHVGPAGEGEREGGEK
ncbi:MAG: hypothetical protein ACT4OG_01425 [Alphaproteobacteria bacterium]